MPRRTARPQPTRDVELPALMRTCPGCGAALWAAYKARRVVTALDGLVRLGLQVRRCRNPGCRRFGVPLRPEQEGRLVLPQHEFGLDVIALVGTLRHAEHRSVPEIHAELVRRGVPICLRSVGNLLDRYDELLALSSSDARRLRRITAAAGKVVLAIDGLQPDVGHKVLWVLRDVLSGEVLLARSLLSSRRDDLAKLLRQVKDALPVPIIGVVSDGQTSSRNAVAEALDGVPHQLCQFHYLREAALPVYEVDRHAKVQLKKKVRAIRPIDREVASAAADGAYDKWKVYRALEPCTDRILIPPRRDARIWRHGNSAGPPLPRDENLRHIRRVGRRAWKREVGYHVRSLAETGVFRMKAIFGHLASRRTERQVTEGAIRCRALNIMAHLGMPDSYEVA